MEDFHFERAYLQNMNFTRALLLASSDFKESVVHQIRIFDNQFSRSTSLFYFKMSALRCDFLPISEPFRSKSFVRHDYFEHQLAVVWHALGVG